MDTITAQQLKRIQTGLEDVALINVLDADDFVEEHIPGSINIPLNQQDFTDQVEQQVGGKDRPIVVYCARTECDASSNAARQLEEAGFTDVVDFEAGIEGWKQAGYELEGHGASSMH